MMNPKNIKAHCGKLKHGIFHSCFFALVSLLASFGYAGENREALMKKAWFLGVEKHYGDAKAIYVKLLDADPADVEAAVALARVTGWSGNYEKAEFLYAEALRQQPDHREAQLGLARVLFWDGKYRESLQRIDLLLANSPDDREAVEVRELVLRVQQANRHLSVRWDQQYQDLSFAPDALGTEVSISYDKPKEWSLRAGFSYIDKFGVSAPGYRLGGSYWAAPETALSLDIELAPRHIVVPRQAYALGLTHALFKGLVSSLRYRYEDYATANVHLVIPGFTWYFYPRFYWNVEYYLAVSEFGGRDFINHSALTRVNWNVIRPMNLFVGFVRANEDFETGNPVDPAEAFSANHVFGGFGGAIHGNVSLELTFDYEKRNNGLMLEAYRAVFTYR